MRSSIADVFSYHNYYSCCQYLHLTCNLTTFIELAEMDVQKEEVHRLDRELSEAEENLKKERTNTEGKLKTEFTLRHIPCHESHW